ncbi:kinase-like domain-containing protein [Amylocystis lapponica]|nr:kinase-like domain-containing protein [Amylocystis lapponica]
MGNGYAMISSPNRGDGSDPSGQKPDAGVYLKARVPKDGRSEWATTRMSIEFKRRTDQDPFDGKHWPEGFESVAQEREANRGQIIHSASKIFLRQHRCFVFSLVIFDKFARIIRWDRSGALVTERFNYTSEPNKMCEFLWRFGRMSAARQGYDPSVVEVTPQESEKMDGAIAELPKDADESKKSQDYKRKYFKQSLADGWLRYKVTTPLHTSHQQKTRSFLICKPHFFVYGAVGRGTRGYVAIDCDTGRFVWLKDAWRVDLPGMEKEGDVLKMLNDKNVRNIPTVVCHGDILGQRTVTQDYKEMEDPGTMNPLKAHCHYRLVEYEIGQALEEFLDGYDLVSVIVDCLWAHHDAYKAGILHRDISAGNILIITTIEGGEACQHGLLNDWELAKELPNPDTPEAQISARQPDRTGTWLFLSAASLQDKYKKIVLQDDLESFFHVLLYTAIQFLPSNCLNVHTFIQRFFEASMIEDGEYICGSAKWTAIEAGIVKTSLREPLEFHFNVSDDTAGPSSDPSSGADGLPNNATPASSNSTRPGIPHPITIIFTELPKWFAAYYRHVGLTRDELSRDPSSASQAETFPLRKRLAPKYDIPSISARNVGMPASMLSSEIAERAANLDTHLEMIALLMTIQQNELWPSNDKVDILGMDKGAKRPKEDPDPEMEAEDGRANKRSRVSQATPPSAGGSRLSGVGTSNVAPAARRSGAASSSASRRGATRGSRVSTRRRR